MKKNTIVFIDGENIPAIKEDAVFWVAQKVGVIDSAKVYGIRNDWRTHRWTELASKRDILEDVRLSGGAEKNKIDNKIKQDMLKVLAEKKNIDIFVLASSDHGYSGVIAELRNHGKKVVVIGREDNMSYRLIESASEAYVC